jgi:hypothetical protein
MIPLEPPLEGEAMERIFSDFKEKILPGITHWQQPSWFAYFSLNRQFPDNLNKTGKIYLTHTTLRGKYILRIALGQRTT